MIENMTVCRGEADYRADLPVKFKWLRPIKIGNRNETEWAYDTKPYAEFIGLMIRYYEDTYRLHNWVYHRQQAARKNCRKHLQPGSHSRVRLRCEGRSVPAGLYAVYRLPSNLEVYFICSL